MNKARNQQLWLNQFFQMQQEKTCNLQTEVFIQSCQMSRLKALTLNGESYFQDKEVRRVKRNINTGLSDVGDERINLCFKN